MNNDSKEKNETENLEYEVLEETSQESEEIISLKSQITELQDKLLRVAAEADNTRKRLEKAKDDARDYSIVSFAKSLLSVADNFTRALEHKLQNPDNETLAVIKGVEMTQQELMRIFKQHEIESIEPQIGSKFDYNLHQAMSEVKTDEHEDGSIIVVMQIGYMIKGRLLRPAIVQVAKKVS